MGAWGHTSFANDDALDWLEELDDGSPEFLGDTLDAVLDDPDEPPEAPTASRAVAAAEVVAAMRGRPAPGLPSEIDAWVVGRGRPDPRLEQRARRAVERVRDDSELGELWAESAEQDQWRQAIDDLLARLG